MLDSGELRELNEAPLMLNRTFLPEGSLDGSCVLGVGDWEGEDKGEERPRRGGGGRRERGRGGGTRIGKGRERRLRRKV